MGSSVYYQWDYMLATCQKSEYPVTVFSPDIYIPPYSSYQMLYFKRCLFSPFLPSFYVDHLFCSQNLSRTQVQGLLLANMSVQVFQILWTTICIKAWNDLSKKNMNCMMSIHKIGIIWCENVFRKTKQG